jgi:hypothetical protein
MRSVVRDSERKTGAEAGHAIGPDSSVVPLENALDDGQADAGPREVRQDMQALEYAEKLMVTRHVESNAVVKEIEDGLAAAVISSEGDGRGTLQPGELPGILEQLFERQPEQEGITKGRQVRHDGYPGSSVRIQAPDFRDHALRQVTDVDKDLVQDMPCYASELQQAVQQQAHFLAGFDDALKTGGGLIVDFLADRFQDNL